jgi:hypothetical protein
MVEVSELKSILEREFSCYYIEEGFAEGWENSLEEITLGSSVRLLQNLDKDSIQEFISFLEKLRNEPDDPFIITLSNVTLIDWNYDSSTWNLLQNILGLIAEKLRTHLEHGSIMIPG